MPTRSTSPDSSRSDGEVQPDEFSREQLYQMRLAGFCIRGIVRALEDATGLEVIGIGLGHEGGFICNTVDAGDGITLDILKKRL